MSAEAVPDPVVRPRQCTARSRRTGQRCRKTAIPGGTVCTMHGGRAIQVRRKADLRLAQLVEPALAQLARELVNTTTGTPMSRLRALENILDRAGYPRGAVVSNAEEARAQLLERLRALAAGGSSWGQPDDDNHDHDHEIIEGSPADTED